MPPTVLSLVASGYRAGTRQAPHAHDDLQITLVLRGTVEERVGASLERASALSVVVKDPGVIHEDHFGRAGALTARLSLERATLADLVEHPQRASAWRWTREAMVAIPFLRIVARGVEGCRHFARDDDDILDLVAAVSARLCEPARAGHATGFADEAHLCREFSRAAGMAPARFRRLANAFGSHGAIGRRS